MDYECCCALWSRFITRTGEVSGWGVECWGTLCIFYYIHPMTKQVKCPLFGHWMHVVRNVWCVPALHISVGHFSGFRAVWPVSPKFSFFNSTIHLHKTWFFRCLLDNKYNKYWCHICYMCCDSKFWPCCKCHFFCRGRPAEQGQALACFLHEIFLTNFSWNFPDKKPKKDTNRFMKFS